MPALAVETTLYVGKHFEVRDHDQPTKYVLNGDTRIARITGSLSTNTRIQRFRLRPGWNLLALAVSATNLSEQLQRPGVVASAHSWNAPTGTYSPVPQVAPSGMVLWVNATTNTTLGVVGTYADPVHRQIAAGATYLASTGLEAWTPTLPPSVAAWSFDSQPPVRRSFSGGGSSFNFQPTWHARLTGDLSSINDLPNTFPPGQVLYVINNAPFELVIPDAALRVRYYHQDHLGSSSVMTDASGVLVEETAFYPFGIPRHEHRLRSVEEHYKFTQKERDRESGFYYFEARYLAGGMSRFLSVDPKYANTDSSAGDPQAMNLYAYVRNNPLQYADPTGLQPDRAAIRDLAPRQDTDPTGLQHDRLEGIRDLALRQEDPVDPVWDNLRQLMANIHWAYKESDDIRRRNYKKPCEEEYQAFESAQQWYNEPKTAEICVYAKALADANCKLAGLKKDICVQEKLRAQEKCDEPKKGFFEAAKATIECRKREGFPSAPVLCPVDGRQRDRSE